MKVSALILAIFMSANFAERAPVEKVTELRERSAELEHQINTLNKNLEALG